MGLVRRIIEYFHPWTDDPADFVLKNERAWFSDHYRYVCFSGNRGRTWELLHCAKGPLFTMGDAVLEYDWAWAPLVFDAEYEAFSSFREKFPTLASLREYEDREFERYLKGRQETQAQRARYLAGIERNIA